MSLFSRSFGRLLHAREQEARRQLQVYLRTADRDLLAANGFDVEQMNFQDPKYLPF